MQGQAHVRSLLALSLLAVTAWPGCSSGGQDTGQPDGSVADLRTPSHPDLEKPEPRRLLKTFSGCSDAMYKSEALIDDFESQATLDANWNWKNDGRFPVPVLGGGALAFGPHNLDPSQWWNNWTPLASLGSFGDILLCVRYRMKPASGLSAGDNTFETSVRGDSGGMALDVAPIDSVAILQTRTSDTTFVVHERVPFTMQLDVEQVVEVALWAHGNHYYAEVKLLDTGELVTLTTDYAMLQPQGIVGMLGWRLKDAVYVDRAVVGTPSDLASGILADK